MHWWLGDHVHSRILATLIADKDSLDRLVSFFGNVSIELGDRRFKVNSEIGANIVLSDIAFCNYPRY